MPSASKSVNHILKAVPSGCYKRRRNITSTFIGTYTSIDYATCETFLICPFLIRLRKAVDTEHRSIEFIIKYLLCQRVVLTLPKFITT